MNSREIRTQLIFGVTGALLAVLVFQMMDFTSKESAQQGLLEAAKAGDASGIRKWIADGADPNAATPVGWRPLHFAAFFGHGPAVDALLELGARADVKHRGGHTPLHRVGFHGDVAIARTLLAHGAPLDAAAEGGETALLIAMTKRHRDLSIFLIDEGAGVAVRDFRSGASPLLFASIGRDIPLLRRIIERGGDPKDRFTNGVSALHASLEVGDPEVVDVLLENGADPNEPDANGDTPLHRAASTTNAAMVAVLLERGADAAQLNARGQTAAELARRQGAEDLAQIIERAATPRSG